MTTFYPSPLFKTKLQLYGYTGAFRQTAGPQARLKNGEWEEIGRRTVRYNLCSSNIPCTPPFIPILPCICLLLASESDVSFMGQSK